MYARLSVREREKTLLRRRKKIWEFDNIEIPCVTIFFPSQSGEHWTRISNETECIFLHNTRNHLSMFCTANTNAVDIKSIPNIWSMHFIRSGSNRFRHFKSFHMCVWRKWFQIVGIFFRFIFYSFCIRWATADEILMAPVFSIYCESRAQFFVHFQELNVLL